MGKVIGVLREHAEIVGAMRVLPDVFGIDDEIAAESLLQPAWNSLRQPGPSGEGKQGPDRRHDGVDHGVVASGARRAPGFR